jgi:8-amino-7-oxononanoate synthase
MRRVDSLDTGWALSAGRRMLMLASNNYLGLAGDDRVTQAARSALTAWGNSSSGSRLLNGTNRLHLELEDRIAEFKQVEAAAVFGSGYMANVGIVSSLVSKSDTILMDELAHASLIDGGRVSRAEIVAFRHQDLELLESHLLKIDAGRSVLIAVDGIYSMDGDFAKLPEIADVARRHGARLLVDDAHATGVAGPNGRGTADHFGMAEADIVTGTLSKSIGVTGGFVAGPDSVIRLLKHNARSFIYSTSMSPSTTASVLAALEIAGAEPDRRERLWGVTRYLHAGLRDLGFDIGVTETPIVPVIFDSEDVALELTVLLDRDDIFASPVVFPACPRDQPRVRLSLSTLHTIDDMDMVLDSFARHGQQLGVIA